MENRKQEKMYSHSNKNTAKCVEISWQVRAGTVEAGSELLLITEVSWEHRGIKQEGTESSSNRQHFYRSNPKSDWHTISPLAVVRYSQVGCI